MPNRHTSARVPSGRIRLESSRRGTAVGVDCCLGSRSLNSDPLLPRSRVQTGTVDHSTRRPVALVYGPVSRSAFTSSNSSSPDPLQAHIAILDETGKIIAVNSTWNRFASANDLAAEFCGPGANYLKACDGARGECSEEAHVVADGIRAVIGGGPSEFYLEYPCHSPYEQRWFSVRVTQFEINQTVRVVVAHDNITGRKLAELSLRLANQRLGLQASSDGLTGLGNRRRFDQDYEATWNHSSQCGQPISLAIIDVDSFKQYNDACGHLAGDDCLRAIAESIRTGSGRFSDTVARYGGEEFAVILPGTDEQQARLVAERIRSRVLESSIPHPASNASPCVTVSIGLGTRAPQHGDSRFEFLHEVDNALYRAKAEGRNRVRIAAVHATATA